MAKRPRVLWPAGRQDTSPLQGPARERGGWGSPPRTPRSAGPCTPSIRTPGPLLLCCCSSPAPGPPNRQAVPPTHHEVFKPPIAVVFRTSAAKGTQHRSAKTSPGHGASRAAGRPAVVAAPRHPWETSHQGGSDVPQQTGGPGQHKRVSQQAVVSFTTGTWFPGNSV